MSYNLALENFTQQTLVLYIWQITSKMKLIKVIYAEWLCLDLQKAFDTINHDILLFKLQSMGFNSNAVSWMSSYLTGREQIVNVNGTKWEPSKITCGMSQGSILGPLLLLLYVNDMEDAVNCKLLLYVDDSALLVSGKDVLEQNRNYNK